MKALSSRWMNTAAYLLMIAVNALANALPLNGKTTGAVSDSYPSLFTPAGFTFAIWGLIYASLAAMLIGQWLPSQRNQPRWNTLSPVFALSCVANSLWIIAWHFDAIVVSMVLMLVLLSLLLSLSNTLLGAVDDLPGRLLLKFPMQLYTGWVVVATIANASALQTAYDANSLMLNPVEWTLLKLAFAGAIAVTVLKSGNRILPLVVAWAGWGISQGQTDTAIIAGAATCLSLLLLLAVLIDIIDLKKARTPA